MCGFCSLSLHSSNVQWLQTLPAQLGNTQIVQCVAPIVVRRLAFLPKPCFWARLGARPGVMLIWHMSMLADVWSSSLPMLAPAHCAQARRTCIPAQLSALGSAHFTAMNPLQSGCNRLALQGLWCHLASFKTRHASVKLLDLLLHPNHEHMHADSHVCYHACMHRL